MTTRLFQDSDEITVGRGIEAGARDVSRAGRGRWNFRLDAPKTPSGRAWIDGGFLHLLVQPSGPKGKHPTSIERWTSLERNSELAGGAKFVQGPGDSICVAAEVPLDLAPELLVARVTDVLEAMGAACGLLRGRRAKKPGTSRADEAASDFDLGSLFAEAAWSPARLTDGRATVDLDVPGEFHQAVLERRETGGARASVTLAVCPELTDASREALGIVLLVASGSARMVRAAVAPGASNVEFEYCFSNAPESVEIDHVLSSLSVCARSFSEEIDALFDENVAARYLESRKRQPQSKLPLTKEEQRNGTK